MLPLTVVALVLGIPPTGFNNNPNRAPNAAPVRPAWQPRVITVTPRPQADLYAQLARLKESNAGSAGWIERELEDARGYLKMSPEAVVVVGRIVVPAGQSPRSVAAQFIPDESGWFVTPLHNWRRPFELSSTEIARTRVQLTAPPERTVWIGDILLTSAPPSERAPVRGVVRTEGGVPATVDLEGSEENINTAHGGTNGTCSERTIKVAVGPDGAWSPGPLPPGHYIAVFDAPGHVSQYRELTVAGPGAAIRVEDIVLERPKHVELTWIGSKTGRFAGLMPRHRSLAADEDFKMFDEAQGNELEVSQTNGKLGFDTHYQPSELRDLGPGTLDTFRNVNVEAKEGKWQFSEVPMVAGHVYLLKTSFDAWALFRVDRVP
jgi:hypothetical protein